jgi:hypothetical protein
LTSRYIDRYLRWQECRLVCLRVRKRFVVSLIRRRFRDWLGRRQSHRWIQSVLSLVDASGHSSVNFRALNLFVAGKATASSNGEKFGGFMGGSVGASID